MSDTITQKDRLISVLNGKTADDRPPVICTGGMMNAAIVQVMENKDYPLPAAHTDEILMAELAGAVHEATGFENIGLPFCMTVEAEILGSSIDLGTLECEPKIKTEKYSSVSKAHFELSGNWRENGRVKTILKAISTVSRAYPEVPVIGNITGPVSTAASVVDPITFYKELRKDPANAHRVLQEVTDFLFEYGTAMVNNGASVISIGDPSATGEILGPKLFEQYALHYINELVTRLHITGVPVIVHICGDLSAVRSKIKDFKSNAISTDALVNLRTLKEDYPQLTTMGNVSTYALEFGNEEKIETITNKLLADKIDIISPACGLSTSTPLRNINAITSTVRRK